MPAYKAKTYQEWLIETEEEYRGHRIAKETGTIQFMHSPSQQDKNYSEDTDCARKGWNIGVKENKERLSGQGRNDYQA